MELIDAGLAGKALEANAGVYEIAKHDAAGIGLAVDDGANGLSLMLASHLGVFTKVFEYAFLVVNCQSHCRCPS